MNTALKVVLVGGAGYILWNLYQNGGLSFLTGGAAPAVSKTTAQPTTVPTRDLVLQAAQKAGSGSLLTFWQWNYYYQQIRGIPGPDPWKLMPTLQNLGAGYKMSVDEWWGAMTKGGFSGFRGWWN